MRNLRRSWIAIASATLFGGLVLAVGAAQAYQQAASGDKKDVGAAQSPDDPTIEKTYFVGNLYAYRNYQVEQSEGNPRISAETIMEGGPPDLAPLVEMIRSCIAPGTWKVYAADARVGSVTPTANGYLAIRHTAKVHEQISALLSNLRTIVKAAMWHAIDRAAPGTSKAVIHVKSPSVSKDESQPKAVAPRDGIVPQSERRKRVRQLLQQLQVELEAMDTETTEALPPSTSNPGRGDFEHGRR
jgi:hypothetical protein